MNVCKDLKMDVCTIYYQSWQIQCCGNPFSVGDKVKWTCVKPKEKCKNAHGITINFEEDHHGQATHIITGIITKIIAERSEVAKEVKVICYDKTKIIREELQQADGWESDYDDDNDTKRFFWGYIVELKDVTLKRLKATH